MSIYEDGGSHADRMKLSMIDNADGSTEGRDPRKVSLDEFAFLGHIGRPLLKVIQAKCLDCSCYQPSEVDKCTAYGCPLWPYRKGTNPWRAPQSEERRAASRARMAALHAGATKEAGLAEPIGQGAPAPGGDGPDPENA